jgi:uncharacterized NAD-dependent epimerase/dehydratase family protein
VWALSLLDPLPHSWHMVQNGLVSVDLRKPYVIFVGEEQSPLYTKTGGGIAHWDRESCVGQLRLIPDAADLGLPDMSVEEAIAAGAKTLIIGIAVVGGAIPTSMRAVIAEALSLGLDVASGTHDRLAEDPEFAQLAARSGARITDVRVPPAGLPVGKGVKRSGKRLLTVGTDCALGKKYTALALAKEMRDRGLDATFRATGQTGIMISGSGIPIDAVVADFVSGAAEVLSPDAPPSHWDVIEGQGALLHPGYAAVSMGLLMGSQPDAIVVCTDATRKTISGWPDFPLPSIHDIIDLTLRIGSRVNPEIQVVGISANTSALSKGERDAYLASLSREHGVPAVDSVATGVGAIVDELQK